VVEVLLSHKADINAVDKEGNTPLHLLLSKVPADREWTSSIAVILLDHKANLSIKNKGGATPLKLALDQNDTGMVELLKSTARKNSFAG